MMAKAIATYLSTSGLGALGSIIYYAHVPDVTGTILSVLDASAPAAPESNAYKVDNYGVQVWVKSADYDQGVSLIERAHNLVAGVTGVIATNTQYINHTLVQSSPYHLGRDEKGRHDFISNYIVRAEKPVSVTSIRV